MRLAIVAAPSPLSMLTTATPVAQLFSMPSSADSPPKLAPYPMLVGTAMTGARTRPPTTLGNAPSMPATAMTTRAASRRSRSASSRCSPATPASYTVSTRLPRASAATRASSATGRSDVPAATTRTRPRPVGSAAARRVMMRATAWNCASGTSARTASNASGPVRVTMRVSPLATIRSAMAAVCAGVLPAPNTISGTPWRTPRW